MRLRIIKKYGNSYGIKLEPADMRDLELAEGDVVDIDGLKVLQRKELKGGKKNTEWKKKY